MNPGRIFWGLALVAAGGFVLLGALGASLPGPGLLLAGGLVLVGLALLARVSRRPSPVLMTAGILLTVILTVGEGTVRNRAERAIPLNVQTASDRFVFAEPVRTMAVTIDAGSLEIRPGESAVVEYTARATGGAPSIRRDITDGHATLDAECRGSCSIRMKMTIPAGTHLEVEAGSALVDVSGLSNGVNLQTGSGAIDVSGLPGDVRLRSGSGVITVEDLNGSLDVETGSGAIRGREIRTPSVEAVAGSGAISLELVEVQPESVSVRTGSGSVDLTVPSGAYAVDIEPGAARRTHIDGITEDPAAGNRIQIRTGSGTARVRGTPAMDATPTPPPA